MCKKLIYSFIVVLLLSWAAGKAIGGVSYVDPPGGWTYTYTGDGAANPGAAALDGTWDHTGGSDAWDGSTINGAGQLGGVSALSDGGVNFLRIQDALTSGSGDDSRKIYFAHSITNDIGATIAGPLLDNGVTISFRARLSTTPPLDGTWPAGGDGYVPHDSGKGPFSIRQSTSDKIITFGLVLGTDGQISSGAAMLGGRSGLCMNSLNGTSPSGSVDIYQGEGTLNLLDMANLTGWHEFWITIQAGGTGTHLVTVYLDGSVTPTVFNVTAGNGNDYDISYMGLGLGSTGQMGAIDVDFFAYKQGVTLPSPAGVQAKAYDPSPADKATDVPRDVVLGWKPGIYAKTHDVYFGTDSTAVQNANTSDISGIYRGRKPKDPCSYDPPETLKYSQIYYWRVDEVNGPPDYTVYPGSVWSFTTEPFAYRITPIAATASSLNTADTGPGKTIDGSGLNASDQHSATDATMWLSSTTPQPTWIQYEFDRIYKLYEMWVWNWNGSIEYAVGFGLKDVTIQYSTDGTNWTQLSGVPQFTQATGEDTYVHNTTVNFQGVAAKYVKITANSNWGGSSLYGLSEVRFFHIPVRPGEPSPASGTTGVGLDNVVLRWRPGREAVSHKVYFSSNSGAVTSGTALVGTVGTNSYNLGPLELGRTYYWKIDEVNLAATPTTWQGDVWNFTTRDNFVVEDFERYTNSDPNIIRETWIDGQGFPGHPGNGSGSKGYPDPNYAELTIIHGGGKALPVDYNNTKSPYYSEVDRTFSATQNWGAYGINLLSLWLRGYPAPVGSFAETPPSSGIYTMTAAGADIWDVPDARRPSKGFHDEFRYAYMQVSGNCAIAVKVESITNTNAWAKAGVMIRDSLDANSAHVMTCLTPSTTNGIAFQYREVAGGISTNDVNIPNINPPYWIDLERDGDTFKAYYSSNGSSWTMLSSTTVTMTDPVYIGLSLTSHNTAAACTAVFSNVSLAPSVTPSWTSRDIGIKSNVAAPLYVTLKDSNARSATVTHDDPNIALATTYQEWLIPMARFTSLNPDLDLTNIQKVTLGVGNRGAGTLYFDDIRLYGPRCLSGRPGLAADLTSDCFVDYTDLDILTDNWLIEPPSSSVNSGLEAYYQFENNYLDSSGHNLNGDPCGSPTFQTSVVGNWAVGLNGSSYVNCKNPPSLDFGTGNWSVCAWIKTTMSGTDDTQKGTIFAKGGDSTGGIRYSLGVGEVTSGRVTLTTDDNGPVEADAKRQVTSSTAVNNNVWHHVVGMRDGSTLRIYVDGLLNGTNTLIAGYNLSGTSQHNAYVGAVTNYTNSSLYKFFNGLIDDVRIYSRALSQAEIEYLVGKGRIDINEDGAIDFRDYAFLADMWLETLLWPPQLKFQSIWAYEFKNDANCYDPGPPKEARDLHLEFNGAVYLIDTGPFTSSTGNGTSKITLTGGVVPANRSTIIRVGTTGGEKTLNKWWWTDATHQRISKEMTGVGPSCKKIN